MAKYKELMERVILSKVDRVKRSTLTELTEAKDDKKPGPKPTDQRDRDDLDLPGEDDAPPNIAPKDDKKGSDKPKDKPKGTPLPGKKGDGKGKVSGDVADLAGRFNDAIKDIGIEDDGEDNADADGVDDPETTSNLPVPLNQLPDVIQKATGEEIELTWHPLPKLPNYNMYTRGVTKEYFKKGLDEEPKNISVATNLFGSALSDIRKFVNYLEFEGVRVDEFEHDLPVVPEIAHYKVKIWHCDGNAYLVQREDKERGGTHFYIYAAVGKGTQSKKRVGPYGPQKKLSRS